MGNMMMMMQRSPYGAKRPLVPNPPPLQLRLLLLDTLLGQYAPGPGPSSSTTFLALLLWPNEKAGAVCSPTAAPLGRPMLRTRTSTWLSNNDFNSTSYDSYTLHRREIVLAGEAGFAAHRSKFAANLYDHVEHLGFLLLTSFARTCSIPR
jgi:hypothetical protein